ncbi:immunoglobulin-like domain-containing protein [Pseudomonas sp. BIC9C]|uniref:immunoglobulin-like domain-containing protein n=1 Tax=Pseudomonas sp. BIC9C TaxID=3078458 RepID=UPI002AD4DDF0|nr:immunoglobulin-like domain-containing protein [Pseudomonas sp. BIC9C]
MDENGTITYTATLTDAQGPTGYRAKRSGVTVTLDSGKVGSPRHCQSSGSLPVTVGNDVHKGPTTVTNPSRTRWVQPGSESWIKTPVETTVNDADSTTVTLSATPSVDENGTITYTATLTDAQGQPVTAQNGSVTVTSTAARHTIAEGVSSGSLP